MLIFLVIICISSFILPCFNRIFCLFKEKTGFSAGKTYALKPIVIINVKLLYRCGMTTERAEEGVLCHDSASFVYADACLAVGFLKLNGYKL